MTDYPVGTVPVLVVNTVGGIDVPVLVNNPPESPVNSHETSTITTVRGENTDHSLPVALVGNSTQYPVYTSTSITSSTQSPVFVQGIGTDGSIKVAGASGQAFAQGLLDADVEIPYVLNTSPMGYTSVETLKAIGVNVKAIGDNTIGVGVQMTHETALTSSSKESSSTSSSVGPSVRRESGEFVHVEDKVKP